VSFPGTPTQARVVIGNHGISKKTLVYAFLSSRLDYCNSLLYGVSDELLQKLQVIQNAAARAVA